MEVYKPKRRRKPEWDTPQADPVQPPEEVLTGFVGNKEASSHEERFAKVLRLHDLRFQFKVVVFTPFQIPGQNYEIDFVVYDGLPMPIEIDDEWIHRTQDEQEQDKLRDQLLDEQTKYWGWQRITRIRVDMGWDTTMFNDLVERLF